MSIEKVIKEVADYFNIDFEGVHSTQEEKQGKIFLTIYCIDTLGYSIEKTASVLNCDISTIYTYLRLSSKLNIQDVRYLTEFMRNFYKKSK